MHDKILLLCKQSNQTIPFKQVSIDININGFRSGNCCNLSERVIETTFVVVCKNSSKQDIEGHLQFPIPEGSVVQFIGLICSGGTICR